MMSHRILSSLSMREILEQPEEMGILNWVHFTSPAKILILVYLLKD